MTTSEPDATKAEHAPTRTESTTRARTSAVSGEACLEHYARTVAVRHGALVPISRDQQDQGVDILVDLPHGERVGIEVASWLKRPQMAAFTDRARTLISGIKAGAFTRGILITRPDLIDSRRMEFALNNHFEVVGPEGLEAALKRGGSRIHPGTAD
jgi:hypothetical protein